MIRVQRPPLPPEIEELMAAERRRAEAYHHPYDKKKPPFKYKAYKNPKLAEILKTMFHGKCAYCESKMHAVHPQDVEHYRPKQAVLVDGKLTKPGYYWLGSHWPNLLSSCIYCNRPNRHRIDAKGAARTQGKGIQFPLQAEASRVRSHGGPIDGEVPLILDPCGPDDPADHLEFSAQGWVAPRKDALGMESARGGATIANLALQRPELVKERCEQAKRILGELELMQVLEVGAETSRSARLALAYVVQKLSRYLETDQPYVGMARQIVESCRPGMMETFPLIMPSIEAEIARARRAH